MKKIILIGLVMIFSMVMVSAQPFNQQLDEGITIETIQFDSHYLNEDKYIHVHLFETSSGLIINDGSPRCEYHLYSENVGWEHIITDGLLTPYGVGQFDYISNESFNETGKYAILLWCEDDVKGGFIQYKFNVIDKSSIHFSVWSCPSEPNQFLPLWILLGMTILLFMLCVTLKESLFGILSGISLFMLYFFIGACAPLMYAPILISGLLLTLYFAFK